MRKFIINRSSKKMDPSKDQVNRYKDFSRIYTDYELLTKHRTRPIFKDPKLYLLFVIIGIVVLLLMLGD